MNIAEIVATFPPEKTGVGNVCYNNSVQLARNGNDVTVFTAKRGSCNWQDTRFKTIRLKPLVRFGNAPFLPGLIGIKDFDIIHLHLPFFFGSEIVYLAHKLRAVPYVVTYHHDPVLKMPLSAFSFFYRATLSKLIDEAKGVFVSSLDYAYNCSMRRKLKEQSHLIELPIGVDETRFNPSLDHEFIRKELGIEEAEAVVLFVGRLDRPHYFKGLQYLLLAFSKLDHKRCFLIIVGEGELKHQFVELSNRLGINSRTFFVGDVSDQKLPLFYAGSDFLVLPSFTMSEAFGIVLIEAMACGKPVIASDLPGVRSLISPWQNGLLAKPGDVEDLYTKTKHLIENPATRKKLGNKGREMVELRYNWERIGLKLDESITRLVNEDLA